MDYTSNSYNDKFICCSSSALGMDSISQDLLAELECPVCYEMMLPPIRLCVEGHSLCNTCRFRLESCPTCRKPLTNARNRALEKVAEKLSKYIVNFKLSRAFDIVMVYLFLYSESQI